MFKVWILIVFCVLFKCAYDDYKTGYINIIVLLMGILIAFVLDVLFALCNHSFGNTEIKFYDKESITNIILGLLPGLLILFSSKIISGIGDGDAYVIMFMGILLGCYDTLKIIYISVLLSFVYAVFLKAIKKVNNGYSYPFVPFVLIGFIICVITNFYQVV